MRRTTKFVRIPTVNNPKTDRDIDFKSSKTNGSLTEGHARSNSNTSAAADQMETSNANLSVRNFRTRYAASDSRDKLATIAAIELLNGMNISPSSHSQS
jgi:hypothetical protein